MKDTGSIKIRAVKGTLWFIIGVAFAVALARFFGGLGVTTNLTDGTPWGLWVGFDVYSDGSSLNVFGASFTNGAPSIHLSGAIATGPEMRLRLTRVGNQWTARYSYDGNAWAIAGTFTHTMNVSSVGVTSQWKCIIPKTDTISCRAKL